MVVKKNAEKDYMEKVEIHNISCNHHYYPELDRLCFLSKNLYNATLYAVRQYYFATKQYLSYPKVNKEFTHSDQPDYRALPAKVSKWVQKLVEQDMKSFFSLLKLKNEGKYNKSVHLPRYADKKKGRKKLHYEKGALSFVKEGYVKLSQTNIEVKINIKKDQVRYVDVVHNGSFIQIIVGYREKCEKITTNENYACIDLGLNNLAAVTSNVIKPFIINGKPLKSINQYANKKISYLQSLLPKEIYTSKQIKKIYARRRNKIKDYMHKASSFVVNQLVSNNIKTLIIGYNKEWKQDITMGKVSNQNFVEVPFYMFKEMLRYKCRLRGIQFAEQEESYTSKCSFLDCEDIKKHEEYMGSRVKRGLFRSKNNTCINADINGSLNIMKKYLLKNEAWNDQIWSDLVETCSGSGIHVINC